MTRPTADALGAAPGPPTGQRGAAGRLARLRLRLADRAQWPRCWWWPEVQKLRQLDAEQWKHQHDEVSNTIRRTMLTLIAFGFFSVLTLSNPDSQLLAKDATVAVPVADVEVQFINFLFVGPLVLVGLTVYLHIFLGYLFRLSQDTQADRLPYIFNVESRTAASLSWVVFYWLPPAVLAWFVYRALPRPEAPLVVLLTGALTAGLIVAQLRRGRRSWPRPFLWALLLVTLLLSGHTLWAAVRHEPMVLDRDLELAGEHLEGFDLRGSNLSNADLKEAHLSKANLARSRLIRATLTGADLPEATLDEANLENAVLEEAHLEKASFRGARLKNARFMGASMAGSDLWCARMYRARLRDADLQGATLDRTNLRAADLRDADLSEAGLRYANLESAKLGDAVLDGTELAGANLTDAAITQEQIDSACVDAETVLPKNTRRPAARPEGCKPLEEPPEKCEQDDARTPPERSGP
jgi:uncharacterized protein YjbI with pentapeptide repeats